MAADPLRIKPIALCRLLNSTPLGVVIGEQKLRNHRIAAGQRIGDDRHVNLLRYAAWLVQHRHAPRKPSTLDAPMPDLVDLAESAAALAAANQSDAGKRLPQRQSQAIAALLTESTHKAAAAKVGVTPTTLSRWLNLPAFQAALRHAHRELLKVSLSRAQAASGVAVDALVAITRGGRREGDRIRAAVALLDQSTRRQDVSQPAESQPDSTPLALQTDEILQLLSQRLRQIDQSELAITEKARLSASLSNSLLNAINVHELKKRIDALEAILNQRKPRKS
jgi:hypothetical protein